MGPITHETVLAVFQSRQHCEGAIDMMLSKGIDLAQVSLLISSSSIEELKAEGPGDGDHKAAAVNQAEQGNLQGMISGMPAYAAAVLAAGVTAASGGALAGVALAALAGGAGGALAGGSAARLLGDNVDAAYDEQLAKGGIVIVIESRDVEQTATAREVLAEQGAEHVSVHAFVPYGQSQAREGEPNPFMS